MYLFSFSSQIYSVTRLRITRVLNELIMSVVQYNPAETARRTEDQLCFMINAASNEQRQVQRYDNQTGATTNTQTVGCRTFLRVLVMTLICHILFKYDSTWCKRCVYYIWLIIFWEKGKNTTFYATLVLVASLNGVPRLSLPFSSKGNGTLAGTVTIVMGANRINLRSLGGILAKDDFQRQVQGIADLGLQLVEVGGIPAPNKSSDLSTEQLAYLSKTVFLIVEKEFRI